QAVLDVLDGGGGLFFRMLSDRVTTALAGDASGASPGTSGQGFGPDDSELAAAIWDLVWAGLLTNDTLAPLRVVASGGRTAPRWPRALRAAARLRGPPRVEATPAALPPPPSPGQAASLDFPASPPRTNPVPGVFNPRPAPRASGSSVGYGARAAGTRYGSGGRP